MMATISFHGDKITGEADQEPASLCSACSIEEQMRLAPNTNWSITIPPHTGGADCRLRRAP